MRTMIRHKWINSSATLSVLLVGLMCWGLWGDGTKAQAAPRPQIEIDTRSAPTGVGPGKLFEVTVHNTICTEAAEVVIRVLDAETGGLVGSTDPGFIAPGTGRILKLFEPDGPVGRRNIVAQVLFKCPRRSLIRQGVIDIDQWLRNTAAMVAMEVVALGGQTTRSVPSFVAYINGTE